MKIRTDFVTNSSSSSFVLCFKSKEDILPTLEKEMPRFQSYSRDGDDDNLAQIVYEDIQNRGEEITNIDEYLSDLREHYEMVVGWDVEDNVPWRERDAYRQTKEFKDIVNEKVEKILSGIKERTKDGKLYTISYSDNNGSLDCMLEHEIMPYLDCCIHTVSYH